MRKLRLKLVLGLCLISSFVASASDYTRKFSFTSLVPTETLPTSIGTLCTPAQDFAWGGSFSGLVRFNNFASYLYEYDHNDAKSIPSNNIIQIVQDKNSNVWVLTDKGLALYDREADNFERKGINALSALVTDDCCYFGAKDTIYRYDYSKNEIEIAKVITGPAVFSVETMFKWFDGSILLSSRKAGQMFFNPKNGNLTNSQVNLLGVYNIWVDSSYYIWHPVFKGGVECYDSNFNLIAKYTTGDSGLSSDIVTSFCEYGGNIWMGTDGGGISIFDPSKRTFESMESRSGSFNSIPSNSILSLSVSGNKSIWAGRRAGGIIVIRETGIQCADISKQGPGSICVDGVSDFFESEVDDKVYICTYGSGLFRVNCDDFSFTPLPSTSRMKIISACDLPDGKILVSSYGQGLFKVDRNSGSLSYFKVDDSDISKSLELKRGQTVDISSCHDGTILLTTRDQIFRYDPKKEELRGISLSEDYVDGFPILPAKGGPRGKYFFNGKYVFSIDPNSNVARVAFAAPRNVLIKGVTIDSHDIMWFATNRGLSYLNIWSGEYAEVESEFVKSAIGVICDNLGQIWVSTMSKLYVYSPSNKTFTSIGESDGLRMSSFLPKPKLLSRSGKLYFAGLNSIARINPGIYTNPEDTPSIITETLLVDGEISDISRVRLNNGNSRLSLRLFVKSDDIFADREFRIKLVSKNGERIISEERPVFDIYNLAHGNYRVYASCTTKNAGWTDWQYQFDFNMPYTLLYNPMFFVIVLVLLVLLFLSAYGYFTLKMKSLHNLDRVKDSNRAEEEKLNFIVNISHELRTPLTLIMGPLERMINATDEKDANYNLLKGIYKQSKRIKTLLNSAVTTAQASRGLSTVSALTPVALNEWIKTVVDEFKAEALDSGVKVRTDFDPAVGVVNFDEWKCHVVLSNIIMNALQHSPSGSDILVSTEHDEARHFVRVSVSDAGEGIKDRDVSSLFNRYFKETEDRSGYGVGLSYAKNIMEQLGGNLSAYNNANGGSTFYFEIPSLVPVYTKQEPATDYKDEPVEEIRTEDVIAPDPLNEEDAPAAIEEMKDAALLIVEDNQELLHYLQYECSFNVKNVFVASNGVEAIKVLNENKVDVIVSDVMMPEMDGFALCRYVKTTLTFSHIPVILLTARSDESSRMLGYKNGADDYITKPFDLATLRDSIENLLKYRASTREQFRTKQGRVGVVDSTFSSADEQFLLRFDKLIRENISNTELNVPFIVDYFGISRTVLFNKVKQLTGMNIQNCINKIRMEKVIELMKTTDLPLAEIGEKSGFASPRYFSTSFKTYTGKTPSQYKKDIESEKAQQL